MRTLLGGDGGSGGKKAAHIGIGAMHINESVQWEQDGGRCSFALNRHLDGG